ncbi:MAG: FkbM family methyltransferase [Aureispira sp.]|nr:FkbM family methyltransferase [Aureispira sp.]
MKPIKKIIRTIIEWIYPSLLFANKSFSQDGEDMLLRAFYEGKKNYKGFYVDIGAHHPYRFSNTAFFYKKKWRGINIEPTPSLMGAFQRVRKRDINLNIGISNSNSKLTFYEFNEPALNSFDKDLSKQRDQDSSNNYKIISEKEIQVNCLKDVLEKHLPKNQTIDFFNVDAEGRDLDVLESNDWNKFRPIYVLVEDLFNAEDSSSSKIYSFMVGKGYRLVGRSKRTFLFEDNQQ